VGLPFRSNTNDALKSKAWTKVSPMLPLKRRGVVIIVNCITAHTAASRVASPKRKEIAARVSKAVKKYVKGITMLTPNRFRTRPFASGDPAANATHRGMSECNQKAATTTLSGTNAYVPHSFAPAKRKDTNFESVTSKASYFLNGHE
jgi:hypothetical protein